MEVWRTNLDGSATALARPFLTSTSYPHTLLSLIRQEEANIEAIVPGFSKHKFVAEMTPKDMDRSQAVRLSEHYRFHQDGTHLVLLFPFTTTVSDSTVTTTGTTGTTAHFEAPVPQNSFAVLKSTNRIVRRRARLQQARLVRQRMQTNGSSVANLNNLQYRWLYATFMTCVVTAAYCVWCFSG